MNPDFGDGREKTAADEGDVFPGELLHVDFREAIEEGLGQTFTTTTLVQWVLGSEDPERGVT